MRRLLSEYVRLLPAVLSHQSFTLIHSFIIDAVRTISATDSVVEWGFKMFEYVGKFIVTTVFCMKQWRTEIPKALQNRAKLNPIVKTVKKIAEFRKPTPQDVRKKRQ